MDRNSYLRGLLLLLLLGFICLAVPSRAEEGSSPKDIQISTNELNELVNLLEDPKRRETFVKDLKTLIQAKEAVIEKEKKAPGKLDEGKPRRLLFVERIFQVFESQSRRIMKAATSTGSQVTKLPEAFRHTRSFIAQPENRARLIRLIGDVGAGILVALIIGLLLRRYTQKATWPERTLLAKLAASLWRVILRAVPYGALIVSLFVLFRSFPSFARAHTLALLFFFILLYYRVALEVFKQLLSPDDVGGRILPLNDENANYFWVWAVRFTNYTAFYSVVIKALFIIGMDLQSLYFIRSLLLLVFPLMLSVFFMQIAREIGTKFARLRADDQTPGQGWKRMTQWAARHWHNVAIGYAWVVFILLIIQYEGGFRYLVRATIGSTFTILGIFAVQLILDRLFNRFFAINERVKDRFPGLEEKTNRYIRVVRKGLGVIVVIIGGGVIGQIWGIPISKFIASQTGSLIILRIIAIAITAGVVVAVIETSQFVTDYFLKEKKQKGKKKKAPSQKMKTLMPMINMGIKIAAGFIGGIVILDRLGVNTGPILAGAGIIGLAVGFGSQTLVKDLINGLFILFEESIRVGDYVTVGSNGGMVESVGLRTVKLRDVSGNVHVVPNSSIDAVVNYSKDFSRYVLDVGVAYREDAEEVMQILREIGEEIRNDPKFGKDILEPLEVLGLDRFEDSAIVIRARFTTKPLVQWAIKREFNRRIKKVFDERGIEIPFPHRTIYMGEPKAGPPPAVHVRLDSRDEMGKPEKHENTE